MIDGNQCEINIKKNNKINDETTKVQKLKGNYPHKTICNNTKTISNDGDGDVYDDENIKTPLIDATIITILKVAIIIR